MVKEDSYIPRRGDLVWLNFSPQALQAGQEQEGHRPALCVSPAKYNEKVGLAIFCPITSEVKDYPFEIKLPSELTLQGVILSDQVKSMDWRVRQAEFIESLPAKKLKEVREKLNTLL